MSFMLNGVHVPHRKHTAHTMPVQMENVELITVPMSMHIGAPAVPCVKVGDEVKVGMKIAEAGNGLSSPIYAGISGKVVKIGDMLLSTGNTAPAITIQSDGAMAVDESLAPPVVTGKDDLINAIKESGTVGLGGAGFPTYVKLNVDPIRIEALIINGAECEPYITSDTMTMLMRAEEMAVAFAAFEKHMGIKRIIIGIESNKKEAIAKMKELAEKDPCIEVKVLPPIYPQGGEKVLIYHTTGKVLPVGKLPIDVGCVVLNCTTAAAIGHYLTTGMPLVSKCVTVDGGAVKEPKNVIVPIGTPIKAVFDFCGGLKSDLVKVLYGGPMMGLTVPDLDAPIIKNTNAILALDEKEAKLPKTTACIRCGSCTNACPFGIAPASIALAFKKKDADRLNELLVNACMECGCCSFVCPANRPLTQTNKLAKAFLREENAKKEAKV